MIDPNTIATRWGIEPTFDTYPHLNRLAVYRGEDQYLHLWYLLRQFASGPSKNGIFPYTKVKVISTLWKNAHGEPLSLKRIRAILRKGHGKYWSLGQKAGSTQYHQIRMYNPAEIAFQLRPWELGITNPLIEMANGPFHSPLTDLRTGEHFRAHCFKTYVFSLDVSQIESASYSNAKKAMKSARSAKERYQILSSLVNCQKEIPRRTLADAMGISRQTALKYERLMPEMAEVMHQNSPRVIREYSTYTAADQCAAGLNDTGYKDPEVKYTYAYFQVRRESPERYLVVTIPANTYHVTETIVREKTVRFLRMGSQALYRNFKRYQQLCETHQADNTHCGRIAASQSAEQLQKSRQNASMILPERCTPIKHTAPVRPTDAAPTEGLPDRQADGGQPPPDTRTHGPADKNRTNRHAGITGSQLTHDKTTDLLLAPASSGHPWYHTKACEYLYRLVGPDRNPCPNRLPQNGLSVSLQQRINYVPHWLHDVGCILQMGSCQDPLQAHSCPRPAQGLWIIGPAQAFAGCRRGSAYQFSPNDPWQGLCIAIVTPTGDHDDLYNCSQTLTLYGAIPKIDSRFRTDSLIRIHRHTISAQWLRTSQGLVSRSLVELCPAGSARLRVPGTEDKPSSYSLTGSVETFLLGIRQQSGVSPNDISLVGRPNR